MTLEELRKTSFYLLLKLDFALYGQPDAAEIREAHELAQQLHRELHERWLHERINREPTDLTVAL